MFYEIFFGIVAGVVFSFAVVAGLMTLFYRLTGGAANYEKMKRQAERHLEADEREKQSK